MTLSLSHRPCRQTLMAAACMFAAFMRIRIKCGSIATTPVCENLLLHRCLRS